MLQTDKTPTQRVKAFDILVICPFAWVISQAGLNDNILWVVIGYLFFVNYAYMRRDGHV